MTNINDDEEMPKPMGDLLSSILRRKNQELTEEIFTNRVTLLAILRKYGYHYDMGRTLKLSEEEIQDAMVDIKYLMDNYADKKAFVSGVVTRPLEMNGDGLEIAIFTGQWDKLSKFTRAWQDERPNRSSKDDEDASPPKAKAVTKSKTKAKTKKAAKKNTKKKKK